MPYTVQHYINKGFDRAAAEYFASGRKKVVSVKPLPGYALSLTFDNGETRLFDVSPLINKGGVFAFMIDRGSFDRVFIDENGAVAWDINPDVDSSKIWNNRVDLSPDRCYMDSTPIDRAEETA